jgi:hypothetical protein
MNSRKALRLGEVRGNAFRKLSATSGKAGGLTEAERLKAARPFGHQFAGACRAPRPLPCRADILVCRFGRLSSRPSKHRTGMSGELAGWKACPTFKSRTSIRRIAHRSTFPELSNLGSLSGRAGGFPIGLKHSAAHAARRLPQSPDQGIGRNSNRN